MILGCIFLNRNLPSLLKVSYILRMASDPPAGVCVCVTRKDSSFPNRIKLIKQKVRLKFTPKKRYYTFRACIDVPASFRPLTRHRDQNRYRSPRFHYFCIQQNFPFFP